jgi:hypothetical protein
MACSKFSDIFVTRNMFRPMPGSCPSQCRFIHKSCMPPLQFCLVLQTNDWNLICQKTASTLRQGLTTHRSSCSRVSPRAMVLTHASNEESRCCPHCSSNLSAASRVSAASSFCSSWRNSSTQPASCNRQPVTKSLRLIFFYVWFSVHHKLIYIKNLRDATWQYVY